MGSACLPMGIENVTPTEWLTAGLLLVTGYYAFVTAKISKANKEVVEAMREQLVAESRPYVTIRILTESILFRLEISNTGRTPAEKLRLKLDKDFFQFGDHKKDSNLAEFSAFTNAIESLPPGASLIFHLATGPNFFAKNEQEKCPTVFSITAAYGFLGRRVEETTTIDIRPYLNSSAAEDRIVARLKDIKEAIEKVAKAGTSR